jgi:hypothetical protein
VASRWALTWPVNGNLEMPDRDLARELDITARAH